jgi:hypothetical protein
VGLDDVAGPGPAQRPGRALGDQVPAQVHVGQVETGRVALQEPEQARGEQLGRAAGAGRAADVEQPRPHAAATQGWASAFAAGGQGDRVAAAGQLGALLAGDARRPAERVVAAGHGDDLQDPHATASATGRRGGSTSTTA